MSTIFFLNDITLNDIAEVFSFMFVEVIVSKGVHLKHALLQHFLLMSSGRGCQVSETSAQLH